MGSSPKRIGELTFFKKIHHHSILGVKNMIDLVVSYFVHSDDERTDVGEKREIADLMGEGAPIVLGGNE